MPETIQQLADRGIQVGAGGQQFSNTGGNTYTPVGGGGDNTAPVGLTALPRMSLSDARGQADKAFSGLVAPMTLDEIRNREATAQGLTAQTADSVYDPAISRQKQVGAAQVSTTEGVVGQRQGFNISTAEQAYVASVENKVQDAIKEVENTKASYIAQGNLAAADRADSQLQSLNEWNSQMVIAKANYALQIMSGDREQAGLELQQARFGLEQRSQEFNEGMAKENLEISLASLTGDYKGSPTFAAKQAEIGNAMALAGITGVYGEQNEPTWAAKEAAFQRELQRMGIDISRDQLNESIRSNRVQEGSAAARLAQTKEDSKKGGGLDFTDLTFQEAKDKAAEYMAGQGTKLDQSGWDQVMEKLAVDYNLPETSDASLITDMQSLTASKRDGYEAPGTYLFGGSSISSPETNNKLNSIKAVYQKAIREEYLPGMGAEANMSKANKIINDLTINLSPTERTRLINLAKS